MSTFPPGPLVIAHRGDSAHHPENTLRAFLAAERSGADAIELDVRLTGDGVPVVLHDPEIVAPDGSRRPIQALTVDALRHLEGDVPDDVRVPTLRDVLGAVSVGLDIEVKNLPGEASFDSPLEAALVATLEALDAAGFAHPVLVTSFNWLTIERCHALRPEVETGFLTVGTIDPRAALTYARDAGHPWILPQAPALLDDGAAVVAAAHADGIRVGTWTVDDPDVAERLYAAGVDAVATNDPGGLVPLRGSGEHGQGFGNGLEQ